MSRPWLTVPTRGDRESLKRLLANSGCNAVVVHTNKDSVPIEGVENIVDLGPPNIHRWWNAGLDRIAELGAREALVVNDDLIVGDASQLPHLLTGLRRYGSTLATPVWRRAATPGKHDPRPWSRNLAGWCWAIDLTAGLRPDEEYVWYGGDDELDLAAKRRHAGVAAVDIAVEHPDHGWPSFMDEAVLHDWTLLASRWPEASAHVSTLRRWHEKQTRGRSYSVLIPYRPGVPQDIGWPWIKAWWEAHLPGAEIIAGTDDGGLPFNRSAALNDAARQATGTSFILSDADIYFADLRALLAVFEAARRPAWVRPSVVYRLDKFSTKRVLGLPPEAPRLVRPTYDGRPYEAKGMICVVPREAYEAVNGFDERFRGWGDEDIAFRLAIETLYGPETRHKSGVLHLHHPREQPRRWPGQTEEHFARREALIAEYRAAAGNPDAMRRVLAEASGLCA